MYELTNGTARLMCAVKRAVEDPSRLARLADVLCYTPISFGWMQKRQQISLTTSGNRQ